MRLRLLMVACLLLGGCNIVMTTTPLFTKADEAGAPGLRHGVWRGPSQSPCDFDEHAAVASWPQCANAAIVGDDAIQAYQDKDGGRALTSTDYVLAAGEPRIMQLHLVDLAAGPGVSVSAYFYLGLRPTAADERGRITAYSAWFVECGPPPPASNNGGKIAGGTLHPLPGMVMDKGGDTCTTTSSAALRNAAGASATWGADVGPSRWVRDADH